MSISVNYPSYDLYPAETLADLQAMLRYAITDKGDNTALALDALLAEKSPAYRATAVAIVYTFLKPYRCQNA